MCKVLQDHCSEYQIEEDAKMKYRTGVVFMNCKGKLKEAIECFTAALKMSPTDNQSPILLKLKEAKLKYENEKKKKMSRAKQFFGEENDL